ncbi:hypothetical protein QAD02_012546 [Eretmocerus hayati]|uniref:Uncharacterized protein n=1 Tax=Eretmocerus hayati TaxID=131215 RepID=A0ACC2P2L0_9HYME|nr:hypothetical protein QAD02_012546 [Eretmocerus hayati]
MGTLMRVIPMISFILQDDIPNRLGGTNRFLGVVGEWLIFDGISFVHPTRSKVSFDQLVMIHISQYQPGVTRIKENWGISEVCLHTSGQMSPTKGIRSLCDREDSKNRVCELTSYPEDSSVRRIELQDAERLVLGPLLEAAI